MYTFVIEPIAYTAFANEEEQIEKCKEWGLLSGKAAKSKMFQYKGNGRNEACSLVGYADRMIAVVEFDNGQKHCIHPSYLKEMQAANFGQKYAAASDAEEAAEQEEAEAAASGEPSSADVSAGGPPAVDGPGEALPEAEELEEAPSEAILSERGLQEGIPSEAILLERGLQEGTLSTAVFSEKVLHEGFPPQETPPSAALPEDVPPEEEGPVELFPADLFEALAEWDARDGESAIPEAAAAPDSKPAASAKGVAKKAKSSKIQLPEEKVRLIATVKEFATVPNHFSDNDDEVVIYEAVSVLDSEFELGEAWSSHSATVKKWELNVGDTITFEAKVIAKKLTKHPVPYKINNPGKMQKES